MYYSKAWTPSYFIFNPFEMDLTQMIGSTPIAQGQPAQQAPQVQAPQQPAPAQMQQPVQQGYTMQNMIPNVQQAYYPQQQGYQPQYPNGYMMPAPQPQQNPWNGYNPGVLGWVQNNSNVQQMQPQFVQQPAPVAQAPVQQPEQAPVDAVPAPAKTEEPVAPVVTVDPFEKEEEKKEILKDIEDKDENYVQQVVTKILDESVEKDFNLQKAIRESEIYKKNYEDAMERLRGYEFDGSRMIVRDEYKPLMRSLEQFKATPDDKNTKLKAVTDMYDMISMITWEDTRSEVQKHYNKMAQAVSNMSQQTSAGTPIQRQPVQQSRLWWIVRTWPGKRF